jgi:hypothetical protein
MTETEKVLLLIEWGRQQALLPHGFCRCGECALSARRFDRTGKAG